jgi:ABC-type multidrug transport system ATPase subunit/ABC-type multidrug transport system permease subunit
MATTDCAILIDKARKTFPLSPANALDDLSAAIKRNSLTGLVGPDGAGKSTLIRLIAGLLSLTQGHISVDGLNPITDAVKLKSFLGYMPQKFALYEDLSVLENLNLYADLKGVLGAERIQAFEKLLAFTDLARFVKRPAGKLSGGMKQKLGLACALLGNPKILLLDEPSVGVDPISRGELWKMVNALLSTGMTIIWSTAYLEEAQRCNEVLLLNEGKLMYAGSPETITQAITGRSVELKNISGNTRRILKEALRAPEVMDGVIKGKNVRLLLRKKGELPHLENLSAGSQAEFINVPPNFEDAFINILGGGPGGDSVLSAVLTPIPPCKNPDRVISAEDLTKKFDKFVATDNITFKVKQGEIFGLLGPNGAGKSTTFKMMCGLLTPTSGTAHVLGIDLQKSASLARQQIGYMAQKFSLYGDLSVLENLKFFSGIYGLSGRVQANKIAEMVKVFDLQPYLHMTTNELPLGFKQRLALASAIMHEPAILFLDEPTSGVDPFTRREFWNHINGIVEKGVTVMVTTHFMSEAEYCDRVGLVYRGKLVALGTPDELKELAANKNNASPTMEEAFINLINKNEKENQTDSTQTEAEQQNLAKSFKFNDAIYRTASLRRCMSMCLKEFYQIFRDPSSIIIAFVLPVIMLFIFGYGINLDASTLRMGLLFEDNTLQTREFENAFIHSPYIAATPFSTLAEADKQITFGSIRGLVTLPIDFTKRLLNTKTSAALQIIADGSEPNTANFVASYASGVLAIGQKARAQQSALQTSGNITIEQRSWFNPTDTSRYYLVPGSIAIIMTVIGAMLTSLVIAREWERGTMEALLSTSLTRREFLLSKFIPYYTLGIFSILFCLLFSIMVLDVPFRGSLFLLWIETSLFLGSALGMGLLVSTLTKNQFNAAQVALNIAFLPAVMLSGFIYEITSMPVIIQAITYLIAARYFVNSLQTLFLAGNIWSLLFKNALFLLGAAVFFISLTYKFTRKRMD